MAVHGRATRDGGWHALEAAGGLHVRIQRAHAESQPGTHQL
jgi:hypothetical protein